MKKRTRNTMRIQRKYYTRADKELLEAYLSEIKAKVAVYFGKTTDQYPYTDYGCIVEPAGNGMLGYSLEGHGIGMNRKSDATPQEIVIRIFRDC